MSPIHNLLTSVVVNTLIERPVKRYGVEQFVQKLEANRLQVAERIGAAKPVYENHRVVTHMVGIERWSQRRLSVALGSPFNVEEYDGYRPEKETAWEALLPMFNAARDETINLTRSLDGWKLETRIKHNMYGVLTARGWLQYIIVHSGRESQKLR